MNLNSDLYNLIIQKLDLDDQISFWLSCKEIHYAVSKNKLLDWSNQKYKILQIKIDLLHGSYKNRIQEYRDDALNLQQKLFRTQKIARYNRKKVNSRKAKNKTKKKSGKKRRY